MTVYCNTAAWRHGMVAMLAFVGSAASAATSGAIYTCTDATGKKFTSDRPIAECSAREQRELNSDGSLRRVLPPTMTADERAQREARDREAAAALAAQQEAVRRDRNLVGRYPNDAAHRKAREAALDDVRKSVRGSEKRIAELAAERKPLMQESEFYAGKALPAKLKQQIEANDVTTEAQRALVQNQQAEELRINALYDIELARLRRLWSGTPPGSLGPLPVPPPPVAAAAEPRKSAAR